MTRQCEELRELLSAYHDGELSPEDARRVADHVLECADCATALAGDTQIEKVVAESTVARASAEWDALEARVRRAIEEETDRERQVGASEREVSARPGWWRGRTLTARRLAFGGLGTIAVAMLVLLLHPWGKALGPAPGPDLSVGPAPEPPAAGDAASEIGAADRLRALGYIGDGPAQERAESPAAGNRADAGRTAEEREPETGAAGKAERAVPAPASPRAKEAPPIRADEPAAEKPVPRPERPSAPVPAPSAPESEQLAAKIARESVASEPVRVSVTSPPAAAPERPLRTEGPSFEPLPPAGGATSPAAVAEWLGAAGGGEAWGRTLGVEADRAAPLPGATVERALSRANALIAQGERETGREGLVLLTGDFAGNVVRERAWAALLDLDAETAFGTRRPDVILPIARSIDAFLEAYPESERAETTRDRQVRVWARLAEIDATYCAAALERAVAWEESLGTWIPFETRMVVARMRDGPCRK